MTPVRILLVEDDAESRRLCAEYLASAGYSVDEASDGMEALFKVKAARPDVVVLDLGLPKLDGVYVAELWRRDPQMSGVPVLAVSAYFDAHNRQRALSAGCAALLAKPFALQELWTALQPLTPGIARRGG